MSNRLPDCIVFDLDGTILHSLPGIECSIRAAFARCGLPYRELDLRTLIGPPISTILSIVGDLHDQRKLNSLVQAFRLSYDSEGWQKTELFPDVQQVLEALSEAGHRLFVVSNKPRKISIRILERFRIRGLFETILTLDSRSPRYSGKAQMLRALAKEHQIDLHEVLMVGDTMEDARSSAEAGVAFAFAAHGYGEMHAGAELPVLLRFDGFAEFLPLIARELIHD